MNVTRNALGEVEQVTSPLPGSNSGALATTKYGYDGLGRTISVTDHLQQTMSYQYDAAAGTITTTQPGPLVTQQQFDDFGNLTKIIDPKGFSYDFEYDKLNRLVAESDPAGAAIGRKIDYVYDIVGNLIERHDRYLGTVSDIYGRVRKWTMDALNRPTKEAWLTTSGNTIHSIHYGYDNLGRLDTVKELRGTQTATPEPEYDFDYDLLDRVTSVTDTAQRGAQQLAPSSNPYADIAVKLSYAYSPQTSDLTSMSTGIAKTKTGTAYNFNADYQNNYQAYDNWGRVKQIEQTGTAAATQPTIQRKKVELGYNAAGQLQSLVRKAGVVGTETEVATSTYSYFQGGGIQQIANTRAGSSISNYAWTYDTLGRIGSFSAPEGTVNYGYDGISQLTSATGTINGTAYQESCTKLRSVRYHF